MTRVRGSRTFEKRPGDVRDAIEDDIEAFVGAGGFDTAAMEGERIDLARRLGFATIELSVNLDREADALLAFEAVEGIFDHMRTEYAIDETDAGTRVTAWTEFTLGGIFGKALDETLVATQRRREFEDQFDYLESRLATETARP